MYKINLGKAENLKTETMNVLTETEQLTSVTVDAEALIQQAAAIKADAEDLASRVRSSNLLCCDLATTSYLPSATVVAER